MKHEVLYQHDEEVVCTCGDYFRTGNVLFDSVTAIEKWARHVKSIRTLRRQNITNKARDALSGRGAGTKPKEYKGL